MESPSGASPQVGIVNDCVGRLPMSHSYFADVLIILAAAMVCVPLFERLRFGPVLGYLVAGFAIGPGAASAVANIEAIRGLGELGIVFMLFTVGLEFTPERLRVINRRVYVLGVSQVLVTVATVAAIARLAGGNWPEAVIIGGGLALSSTALVVPVLADIGKLHSSAGRTAIAILLLQDLAVGPLLVLVETLGGAGGPLLLSLGLAVVKAGAAVATILIIGRVVLRPLFRLVAGARSPELFVGMALLIALGTSWGTEQAGLSMAFGGFLAGMLLGETEYRHQVAADVEPFRGLLLGLFFMTVGMIVDVETVLWEFPTIALLAMALMAGKLLLLVGLGCLIGLPPGRALGIGAILSQGGEFAFILFGAAAGAGLMQRSEMALLSAVVALTMLVTPVAARSAKELAARLQRRGRVPAADLLGETLEAHNHVIIVGFGEIGRIVVRLLRAYEVPYLILDLNGDRIRDGRGMGEPVYYGDATRPEVLRGVKAGEALAVVVTTDAPGVAEGLAALRRHAFPDLNILVRGGGEQSIIALRRAGLTPVGQEATDTGLKLTGAILDLWHAAPQQAAD
jgi:CPA2 family monovalent cation:H+ antiporter-2